MPARSFKGVLTAARQLWDAGRRVRNSEADAQDRTRDELNSSLSASEPGTFHLVVFGTAASGKTSLINALIGREAGETAAVMGTTRGDPGGEAACHTVEGAEGTLTLIDTPGLSLASDDGAGDEAAAFELALSADLLLFVVDHDLLRTEFDALTSLVRQGKRGIVVLNKKDRFPESDLRAVLDRLRERLVGLVPAEDVVAVAANPRPMTVRVRKVDGTEETVFEYEHPDLSALEERIEVILAREGDVLRAGNLLLKAYLARKVERERLARERRERAEEVIERHQWLAAAAAFAVPLPQLETMAAGAVEYRMVSEIAEVYGVGLSAEHVRMISVQMVQAMLGRRVVETALTLVSRAFKASLIGYAAGGLVQAATIAYLTHVTGRTFLDYFENGQDWGEGGMQGALTRQLARHSRSDFFQNFFRHVLQRFRRRPPLP